MHCAHANVAAAANRLQRNASQQQKDVDEFRGNFDALSLMLSLAESHHMETRRCIIRNDEMPRERETLPWNTIRMIGDKNNSELKYDMNFYKDAHLIDRSNVRCC